MIYLPWNNYNGWKANGSNIIDCSILYNYNQAALLAKQFHPCWSTLSPAAKQLMIRNSYIMLSETLCDPVDYVICWTPDGATTSTSVLTGGTGHGIRMANHYNIPVKNYANRLLCDVIDW